MASTEDQEPTPIFADLDGIAADRERTTLPASSLTTLLELCGAMVKRYTGRFDKSFGGPPSHELYQSMHAELTAPLASLSLDEQLLQEFVLARAGADYDPMSEEARALGIFSGNLLHYLTLKNRAAGKETKIHIDLHSSTFHYLFWFAKEVDEVFIENASGNSILEYAASYGGRVGLIRGQNLAAARHFAAAAGYERGNVGIVAVYNAEGDYIASRVGDSGGSADAVLLDTINGTRAGEGIASKGTVDTVFITNVRGDYTSAYIAQLGGTARVVVLNDIRGDFTARENGPPNEKARIGFLILRQNKGSNPADQQRGARLIQAVEHGVDHSQSAGFNLFQTQDILSEVFLLSQRNPIKDPEGLYRDARTLRSYVYP